MPRFVSAVIASAVLVACSAGSPPDGGTEAGADGGTDADAGIDCTGTAPRGFDGGGMCPCNDVDVTTPDRLAYCCALSAIWEGGWGPDRDGLPSFGEGTDPRCDPAFDTTTARAWKPHDGVHLLGNGRGLVAMAHVSGSVELYTQDRGHAFTNHVDAWPDPRTPDFGPQLGGLAYAVVDGNVRSTRVVDAPPVRTDGVGPPPAGGRPSTIFGVGYVETQTVVVDLQLTRRVLAPDLDVHGLVSETTLTNGGDADRTASLVEVWDPNLYEVKVELLTSDVPAPGVAEGVDRRRRAMNALFTQTLAWDAAARVATVVTTPKAPGTTDRLAPSETDWYPNEQYLAVLDDGVTPDAVWLDDRELFTGTDRAPPAAVAGTGSAASRTATIDGDGAHAFLAVRVPVTVPAHGSVTRRFAYGYVPGGAAPDADVATLRAAAPTVAHDAATAWHDKLVWAAVPGQPHAAELQRELAWSSYYLQAGATTDEYHQTVLVGQGGAYKFIHGLDGAIGDLAIIADALDLIDPVLARGTLRYAMQTQHDSIDATPWRYPYATTGVGTFSDVGIYHQRSDAYWLVPTSVARYVALTRDAAFLDQDLPYWPRADGEHGTALDHLTRGLDYARDALGLGARGLVALGTNDYADGVASLATGPATPMGTSSTYNAGFIVNGLPLAADVVESRDAALATRMRDLVTSQRTAYATDGWLGSWYARGFIDDGSPLAPSLLFVEPQALAILAGIPDDTRRDGLLDVITAHMETPIGALSTVAIDPTMPGGGPDQPQIGGVWPVANAWVTEAHARRDAAEGWDSLVRNTLFAHAQHYPTLWYGVWTGPDSFYGPDATRPGEADANAATAHTDYPALNVHAHASPLRAMLGLLGVHGTAAGIGVAPRLPTETYDVRFPRLRVAGTPTSIAVDFTPSASGLVELRIVPPAALATGTPTATVDGAPVTATRVGTELVVVGTGTAGTPLRVAISAP